MKKFTQINDKNLQNDIILNDKNLTKNLNENAAKNSTSFSQILPFSKVINARANYIKKVRDFKLQENATSLNLKEQKVLKISMFSALILAIFGISFGLGVKSLAVVFDGFVSLVSVGLGALSVITSRYIYKEDDELFQYGYVRFEPMVNLFKSLVLVFVCVYAFINAISSMFSGGYEVRLGAAAIYSVFAFCFCSFLFFYTNFASKILESDLIKVDSTEWKIDCVLYLGAIIAFGVIFLFFTNGEVSEKWAFVANYIDAFLLCILSILLCISPVRIAVANFKDLLMVAPKDLDDKITLLMEKISKKYKFSDYDTHTAKSGRFFMVEINILVREDYPCLVSDLDKIREEIERDLNIPSYKIWLSISWTTDPKWL